MKTFAKVSSGIFSLLQPLVALVDETEKLHKGLVCFCKA